MSYITTTEKKNYTKYHSKFTKLENVKYYTFSNETN